MTLGKYNNNNITTQSCTTKSCTTKSCTTKSCTTSYPSICIPRINHLETSEKEVKEIFEKALENNNCIKNVIFVNNHNDIKFKRVFIHLNFWPENEKSQMIRNRLLDNIQLKIMFNDPLFWRCSASRT